jgi:hypothetical protein
MLRRGVVEDVEWMEAHGDLPAVSSLVRGFAIADHRSSTIDVLKVPLQLIRILPTKLGILPIEHQTTPRGEIQMDRTGE